MLSTFSVERFKVQVALIGWLDFPVSDLNFFREDINIPDHKVYGAIIDSV